MSVDRNIQVVKDAYAAFMRADIAAVLESLTDDIEWEGVKGTEGTLPQAGLRRGKAEVGRFFREVDSTTQFERFEPREFIAQGDAVAVVGMYSGIARGNGQRTTSDWVMVFNFRDGKVARFREFCDSASLVRAHGGALA